MYCCEQVKNQYGHIIAQKKSSYNYLSIKKTEERKLNMSHCKLVTNQVQ